MTETSKHVPHQNSPFAHQPPEDEAIIPTGTKGYLAFNPDFGKDPLHYQPLFKLSTNPADAIPASMLEEPNQN